MRKKKTLENSPVVDRMYSIQLEKMETVFSLPELRLHLLKSVIGLDTRRSSPLPIKQTLNNISALLSVNRCWYSFSKEATEQLEETVHKLIPAPTLQAEKRISGEGPLRYCRRMVNRVNKQLIRRKCHEREDLFKVSMQPSTSFAKTIELFVLFGEEEEFFAGVLCYKKQGLYLLADKSYTPPDKPWISQNFARVSTLETPFDSVLAIHPSFLLHSPHLLTEVAMKCRGKMIVGLSAQFLLHLQKIKEISGSMTHKYLLAFLLSQGAPNGPYLVSRSYADILHPMPFCEPCSWGFYKTFNNNTFVHYLHLYLLRNELMRETFEGEDGKRYMGFVELYVTACLGVNCLLFVHPDEGSKLSLPPGER